MARGVLNVDVLQLRRYRRGSASVEAAMWVGEQAKSRAEPSLLARAALILVTLVSLCPLRSLARHSIQSTVYNARLSQEGPLVFEGRL